MHGVEEPEIENRVNWPAFLTRHDLVWNRLPDGWKSGAFLGNGQLGAMAFKGEGARAFCWRIGRSDVVYHSVRIFGIGDVRIGIGELVLVPSGAILSGTMRVFPGVPDAWKDVVFHQLRAEGAFLVSASRKDGATQWVRIESLAGEPCRLWTDMTEPIADRDVPLRRLESGVIELGLKKSERVILVPRGASPDCVVAPVAAQPGHANFYGLH